MNNSVKKLIARQLLESYIKTIEGWIDKGLVEHKNPIECIDEVHKINSLAYHLVLEQGYTPEEAEKKMISMVEGQYKKEDLVKPQEQEGKLLKLNKDGPKSDDKLH